MVGSILSVRVSPSTRFLGIGPTSYGKSKRSHVRNSCTVQCNVDDILFARTKHRAYIHEIECWKYRSVHIFIKCHSVCTCLTSFYAHGSVYFICLMFSVFHRTLRTTQHHQIFICLCATLMCLYVSFLVMVLLDSLVPKGCGSGVPPGPCGFLTAVVHYFVLSAIAWMGVEGFNTYLVIVKVFKTYIPNFMMKAMVAAWGKYRYRSLTHNLPVSRV